MLQIFILTNLQFHSQQWRLVSLKTDYANARYPVSTHESFIWQNCNVERFLRNLLLEYRGSFYVLDDSGYPLRSWILTFIVPQPPPNTPEAMYNNRHIFTRSVLEQCFGRLGSRFRCLLGHRTLHYCPESAGKIGNKCMCCATQHLH